MRKRRYAAGLLLALSAGACFRYVPGDLEHVAPEQGVRLRLAPAEATRLSDFLPTGTRTLEGALLTRTADSVLVLVDVHSELRGDRVQTLRQRVQVARAGVLDVERRELDRGRTYVAVGSGVLGLGILVANQVFGGGDSEREGPVLPPDEARIPLLRITLPLGGPGG